MYFVGFYIEALHDTLLPQLVEYNTKIILDKDLI
jgi:hypothetical protein